MSARRRTRAPGRPRERARPWHAFAAVALLTLAPYLYTLGFDFTYDDHHHFLQNDFVQNPENLANLLPGRYFAQEFPDQARPVLVLSEFVDRALGGSAAVCHLHSALWHAGVATLVMALATSLGFSLAAGAAAGIIFGLHPILVEAVAGISNREDLLAAAFVLLALLAAQKALSQKRWLIPLGVLFALALGAKESALALPGLVVVLALCSTRYRPPSAPRRAWLRITVVLTLVLAGWATFQLRLGYPSLLPGAGGTGLEQARTSAAPLPLVRALGAWQEKRPETEPSAPLPPPRLARKLYGETRLRDGIALEAFRAWQLIVPWPSAPEYDLVPIRTPLALLLGALALGALGALALFDFRRTRKLSLGIGWFAVSTVPIAVPTLLLNPLADRYLYLPAVGFALVAGYWLGTRLPERLGRPDATGWALVGLGLCYFVLLLSGLSVWKNDLSLFTKAVASAPRSARARLNLGSALLGADRLDEAEPELELAFELDPSLIAAPFDLAILAERRGATDLAIERYARVLGTEPLVAERPLRTRACQRLGSLLVHRGRVGEARALLTAESAREPGSVCVAELRTRLDAVAPER